MGSGEWRYDMRIRLLQLVQGWLPKIADTESLVSPASDPPADSAVTD